MSKEDTQDPQRRICIQGVRICAASDAEREKHLGKYSALGISVFDALADAIVDDVDVLEERWSGVPAMFTESEWRDLLGLRDMVVAAREADDNLDYWSNVRDFAQSVLARHQWDGPIDPRRYL